ncbi:hypothetical protein N3K66_001213 [Trichothecium roseum]|uniref:Uncharacterized protein n=1 Tax=Trichothecium roseum TaxID=47278 RepID=A0ACC0VEG3_9HYPO|nr:hypothetical protein N3K66_001213 [Trichothecium roseum]
MSLLRTWLRIAGFLTSIEARSNCYIDHAHVDGGHGGSKNTDPPTRQGNSPIMLRRDTASDVSWFNQPGIPTQTHQKQPS